MTRYRLTFELDTDPTFADDVEAFRSEFNGSLYTHRSFGLGWGLHEVELVDVEPLDGDA